MSVFRLISRSLVLLMIALTLVAVAVSTEQALAQSEVEITVADLRDDTAGADPKKAYEKVNAKIAASSVTGGTVVTFPEGEFKDVGEILIAGKKGTAATTSPAAPAKPITFRGNGTVFTGKIMINVQDSEYLVIEGFTFRDTQVPDRFTHNYADVADGNSVSTAPHTLWEYELTSILWLNTGHTTAESGATEADCPSGGPVNNVTIRNNEFRNTHAYGIKARAGYFGWVTAGTFVSCRNTSAVEISGNVLIGIGLGPNADYLDAAKTLPGTRNWKNAIEAQKAYGWTVRNNYIGAERDGTAAAGTTFLGIKIDNAFGKTLIENNVVNGTASSGIVVGGDGSTGANAADDAEITIRNNRVTNSRNDAWFVHFWADGFSGGGQPTNGYIGPWTPGAGMLVANAGMTDEQADRLLMPRIYALPSGFTEPFLGGSRAVSSVVAYASNGDRTNTGDAAPLDVSPGTRANIPEGAVVRNLKPGIEAGIELNRLTAKTILVENNELTDNVVGLVVCPSWYCYADHPFQSLVPMSQTPAAGTLKVPTVRNNRIYDNDKTTDMPNRFVRADVINALTETNAGAGKNVLVLAGNYLGDSPGVEGDVNTDDLADAALDNVGPKETDPDPPALDADAAGEGAALSGTTITLRYSEELDGDSVPAAAAFTVAQTDGDGLTGPIDVTGVEVSGMSVTLTLAKAPESDASVTVSYDPAKAGSGTGRGPIRDVAGNVALPLAPRTVTAADSMPPEQPMGPGESPQPATTGGGDGGCTLASGGGGGAEPGALLAMMLAMFVFGLGRNVKKKN